MHARIKRALDRPSGTRAGLPADPAHASTKLHFHFPAFFLDKAAP